MPTRKSFEGHRKARQSAAKDRDEAYAKLTIAQKLALLDKYGFTATRQRARLAKQLEGKANASSSKKVASGRSST